MSLVDTDLKQVQPNLHPVQGMPMGMDARILAPTLDQNGRIRIPGITVALTVGQYRRLVALYSRILEAKQLIDNAKAELSLVSDYPAQGLTWLQASRQTANLFYKREDLTQTRAYKLRGAYVAMAKYMAGTPEFAPVRAFMAVSTGNHALGVLKAAELLKPQSVRIVVPTNTSQCKLDRIQTRIDALVEKGVSAVLQFQGASFDEARVWAMANKSSGEYYLDPYNDPWVVAGQGTIGLELYAQLKSVLRAQRTDGKHPVQEVAVVAPIGGGGLLGGLSTALKLACAWDADFRHVNVNLLGLRLESLESLLGDAIKVFEPASDNQMLFSSLGVEVQMMGDGAMQAGLDTVREDLGILVEGASGGTVFPVGRQSQYTPSPSRLVVSVLSGGNVQCLE